MVSKEVEWQNGEKYLSVELIDPTEPYRECFQIDLSNIDGSLNVLLPPLKYIIFSNRSKKLQSEKEGNSSKKKFNIKYFHGISDNQSDKSVDQDSDKKLDAWDLENIIDTPSEQDREINECEVDSNFLDNLPENIRIQGLIEIWQECLASSSSKHNAVTTFWELAKRQYRSEELCRADILNHFEEIGLPQWFKRELGVKTTLQDVLGKKLGWW